MGINTRDVKLLAFAIGATFGGVAGGLFASFQGFISPESFTLLDSIMVLCMVVLGGMGNVAGVVLGAVLLTALPEALRYAGPFQQASLGAVYIDPADLTKSTALVKADLKLMTLYQQKRADDKGDYSERKKSDLQNEHARGWLQLDVKDGEVTPAQAEMNRWAEIKILKVDNLSATDVTKLTGPERKVTATVSGDFRLHGRKATKSAKIELNFKYSGDKLDAVEVKTVEPFLIPLEEFEIHPRDAAGKIVKSLSDALSSNLKGKVAKDAPVTLSFVARAK
jgi:hypothetical protein